MARKIIDITSSESQYDILSKTPKNYSDDNYFLKQLQHKVNADWKYRPNRVDIEYEKDWGRSTWEPIEVVIQTVKTEKGTAISNDVKNIVFKYINEDRFKIGSRFRFSPRFDLSEEDKIKNVWLTTNQNSANLTSSVVIERCNGIFGSVYKDKQGISHYHYEPVIQGRDLSSNSFAFDEASVLPQSQLLVISQYNDFTKNYILNQRFIVGARREDPNNPGHFIDGQVYRIIAINRFYSDTTFNPESVGLLKIYMEITESSPYDDWDNMIAYQSNQEEIHIDTISEDKDYSIIFKTPDEIPADLTSEEIIFTPVIVADDGTEYIENSRNLKTSISLENWPVRKPLEEQDIFVSLEESVDSDSNYIFKLKRNKIYLRGDLIVTVTSPAASSPSGNEIISQFKMVVSREE